MLRFNLNFTSNIFSVYFDIVFLGISLNILFLFILTIL